MWRWPGLAAVLAVTALAGCRGRAPASTSSGRVVVEPTFSADVAPIVFRSCAPCHRPGEAAPFSLLSYADVKQRSRLIADATANGFMPPWLPEPGHGEFAGERRLAPRDIDVLRRWHDRGAPEGNPADRPPLPSFGDGWRLGEPDLVIRLPQPFRLPAESAEVWRNFVLPIPVADTRFVRTIEIRPGNARVVHHALVGVDPTRSSRRRDERDEAPGFDGMDMGDSHAPDGHLLGWSPGMAPFPGVEGKAWRLDPNTDLVLQLHLTPSGKAEVVDPLVGLFFAERPMSGVPLQLMRLDADQALDIPVGARRFEAADSFTLPVDLEILAVYPHAHFLAKTMTATATLPDATERWLIRIDDWDFKWQDIYRYASPLALPRGTTIHMRYTYDNSAENPRNPNRPPRRVIAGLRSSDEMAHLQLQVAPRSALDGSVLKEALNRHALQKNPDDAWAYYELGNALRDQDRVADAMAAYRSAVARDGGHAAAHNNLGVLLAEQRNTTQAIDHYRVALATEPDFADAHYNLANALRAAGGADEAIRHYREALRLEPRLYEAHINLGEALASRGRIGEALERFREAVRLQPASAQAHNSLGAGLGLQGDLAAAIAEFREALRLDPQHAGARENLRIALEGAAR
jgi:tetratricopeptide (TPR) repeat protein